MHSMHATGTRDDWKASLWPSSYIPSAYHVVCQSAQEFTRNISQSKTNKASWIAPDSGVSHYVQYQCGLMRREMKSTRKDDGIEKLPNYTAKIASLAMIILISANIKAEEAQSNVHEKCREGNRNRGNSRSIKPRTEKVVFIHSETH